MATQWVTETETAKRRWLCVDGSTVIEEPVLEWTPSGRKCRVVGTSESYYARDVESLITQEVRGRARRAGTRIWMGLHHNLPMVADGAPVLLWLTRHSTSTHLWWRFKHPSFPVSAKISLEISTPDALRSTRIADLRGRLQFTVTQPEAGMPVFWATREGGDTWARTIRRYAGGDAFAAWMAEGNPPAADPGDLLSSVRSDGPGAVSELLRRLQALAGLDSVAVPDLREDHGWLDLKFLDTNVTDAFMGSLADYLDAGPAIRRVATAYAALQRELRSLGVVLGERKEDHFLAALGAGREDALLAPLELRPDTIFNGEETPRTDRRHFLHLHLPTGTFAVACSASETVEKDTVAQRWEEAKIVASLTGQEDELLAYARGYASHQASQRAERARLADIAAKRKNAQAGG